MKTLCLIGSLCWSLVVISIFIVFTPTMTLSNTLICNVYRSEYINGIQDSGVPVAQSTCRLKILYSNQTITNFSGLVGKSSETEAPSQTTLVNVVANILCFRIDKREVVIGIDSCSITLASNGLEQPHTAERLSHELAAMVRAEIDSMGNICSLFYNSTNISTNARDILLGLLCIIPPEMIIGKRVFSDTLFRRDRSGLYSVIQLPTKSMYESPTLRTATNDDNKTIVVNRRKVGYNSLAETQTDLDSRYTPNNDIAVSAQRVSIRGREESSYVTTYRLGATQTDTTSRQSVLTFATGIDTQRVYLSTIKVAESTTSYSVELCDTISLNLPTHSTPALIERFLVTDSIRIPEVVRNEQKDHDRYRYLWGYSTLGGVLDTLRRCISANDTAMVLFLTTKLRAALALFPEQIDSVVTQLSTYDALDFRQFLIADIVVRSIRPEFTDCFIEILRRVFTSPKARITHRAQILAIAGESVAPSDKLVQTLCSIAYNDTLSMVCQTAQLSLARNIRSLNSGDIQSQKRASALATVMLAHFDSTTIKQNLFIAGNAAHTILLPYILSVWNSTAMAHRGLALFSLRSLNHPFVDTLLSQTLLSSDTILQKTTLRTLYYRYPTTIVWNALKEFSTKFVHESIRNDLMRMLDKWYSTSVQATEEIAQLPTYHNCSPTFQLVCEEVIRQNNHDDIR